jgi:Na+-transporting NADH:ubiquinone oxidoreductase subunit A
VSRVALLGADTVGLKAKVLVEPGARVRRGQPLFEDRKSEGVVFTAPGAGTVLAVNRGERRALTSLVIELTATEQAGTPGPDDFFPFTTWREGAQDSLTGDEVRALLVESGLWTALRARPYSRVPAAAEKAEALFVTAMDTHPHAPPLDVVLAGHEADFALGLRLVSKLTEGKTYLCRAPGTLKGLEAPGVEVAEFEGRHPAGTVGLHIHTLHPVGRNRVVWHLGAQDVLALGRLARTGKLPVERVISLAGPAVKEPRLLQTRLGASLDPLTAGALAEGQVRVVSGSVLGGRTTHDETDRFLGRYHAQVSCLHEVTEREFLGWAMPGLGKFSSIPTVLSRLLPSRRLALNTDSNGEPRAMVPIGLYERVMPMDIMPTFLLRALAMDDLEQAEKLGALELDEEDLALCSFVCPGKTDWGTALRRNLDQLRKEG